MSKTCERISKNFYQFFNVKTVGNENYLESLGFDSYSNQLQYKTSLERKLAEVNERIALIEALGMTEDDLSPDVVEETENVEEPEPENGYTIGG